MLQDEDKLANRIVSAVKRFRGRVTAKEIWQEMRTYEPGLPYEFGEVESKLQKLSQQGILKIGDAMYYSLAEPQ